MKTTRSTDPVTGRIITLRTISMAEAESARILQQRPLHAVPLPSAMDPVRPWRNGPPRATHINRKTGVRDKGYFVGQAEINASLRGWEQKPKREVA